MSLCSGAPRPTKCVVARLALLAVVSGPLRSALNRRFCACLRLGVRYKAPRVEYEKRQAARKIAEADPFRSVYVYRGGSPDPKKVTVDIRYTRGTRTALSRYANGYVYVHVHVHV